jgi:hypothetical protein
MFQIEERFRHLGLGVTAEDIANRETFIAEKEEYRDLLIRLELMFVYYNRLFLASRP